jgi:ABC-type oligopeptide transport system substrate-binding subunit
MVLGKAWNRRLALAGGAAVAAGAGALALHRSDNTVHPLADARTFHRGNATEPETLDSSMSTSVQDDAIMGELTVGLMTEDPLANSIPGMAISWDMSAICARRSGRTARR